MLSGAGLPRTRSDSSTPYRLCQKKEKILYVTFIDFSQAYDQVPRATLLRVLHRSGCGSVMLAAVGAMHQVTESVLGTAVLAATTDVRQGSPPPPPSCLLFILYVSDVVKRAKENCGGDGFLSWLHVLVMMDDTALLAAARQRTQHELLIVKQFCNEYGMKINQTKTISCDKQHTRGSGADSRGGCSGRVLRALPVLGFTFAADGSVSTAVRTRVECKMPHVTKHISFLKKNNDILFQVKRRVLDAALMSAILYGCESWLSGDLKPVVTVYSWCTG